MSKLLLLDGHSLAYRSFFALPPDMQTKSGTFTNAVYGFTSMLVKMLADEKPDYLAVTFDTPKPTFRDELDENYKAGRQKAPDLFVGQLPLIHEVLDVLKVPVLEVEGVEADDVIATLADEAKDQSLDVIIVTGDRDAYQLVSDPHIKVLYNKRGVTDYALYNEAGIVEKLGIGPSQYTNYAALRGDTSDNLPGVPGIGEKTAAKLISSYGSLEGIYEHLAELPPKQRENLATCKERVFLNRQMSELQHDVPIDAPIEDLLIGGFDLDEVRNLFNQLEFRGLYDRLVDALGGVKEQAPESATFEVRVDIVQSAEAAAALLTDCMNSGERVSLAVHWAGTPMRSEVLGIAVAGDGKSASYIPAELWKHPNVEKAGRGLLEAGDPLLIAHNAKELMHALDDYDVRSLDIDTTVLAYLLDPSERKHDLAEVSLRYAGLQLHLPEAVEGQLSLESNVQREETGRAAAALFSLVGPLQEAINARELWSLYERIERPLVRVLARMEKAGIRVDQELLGSISRELGSREDELTRKIHTLAGEDFNINSTQQLRTILFTKLGLTPVKKTKTGPSTDADSLQKLSADHPIIERLLEYRELEKLRSTYADALPPLIGSDGRIHAMFNQTATTTGRISSENPNMQNIPVRTTEGLEMRKVFIAAQGHGLLSADYSQIELRVLAHLTKDPGLIDAFSRDADVHTATAARVFKVSESDVDEVQRRFAKVVNYGLAYGMEAYGLAQRMGVPTEEAQEILDAYFESFPNVERFMEETIADAKRKGYTTTLFGRRRIIPELSSSNYRIRQMGERMAQNAPVQGSAADIFKLAMLAVDRAIDNAALQTQMILTVHDELVFEVPNAEREQVTELIVHEMEEVTQLNVPLRVECGFGANWAEAKH